MIERLYDEGTSVGGIPNPIRFNSCWLDEPKKGKKGEKGKKKAKKAAKAKGKYAQLAFQYGVLASRYDTLTRMVELAVSTKRQQLNDDLLDGGLVALRPPRITPLPEL